MEKKTIFFTVFMGLILITSGCVEGEDSDVDTNPVQVESFSMDPNPVPADQQLNAQIQLVNDGNVDAEDAYARLFGPSFASSEADDRTWRTSDRDAVSREYRTMDIGTLRAGTDNSPAVPSQDSITFTSPSMERDVDTTFRSQIYYKYSTEATFDLQIMSGERYQDVGAARTQPTADNSPAPIQIEVQGTTPHVFYDEGEADDELCLTITNEGGGDVFLEDAYEGGDIGYDVESEHEDKIEITIEDVGNVNFESQETGDNTVEVDIIGGSEGHHCYDMILEGLGDVTDLEQTDSYQVEASYGYMEESSSNVMVEARAN